MSHSHFQRVSKWIRPKNVIAFGMIAGFAFLSSQMSANEPQCQAGMVRVPGHLSCIDMYEWPNIKGTKPILGLSALPEATDKKNGLTYDAVTICATMHKRVCDRSEWIAACKGASDAAYPWGSQAPEGRDSHPCNTDKTWRAPNETKIFKRDYTEMLRLDQSEASGHRSECRSASGAFDMTGNAEEWVRCPGVGDYGWCLAGRFWSAVWRCDQMVVTHSPTWHYYTTGVRCCKDMNE